MVTTNFISTHKVTHVAAWLLCIVTGLMAASLLVIGQTWTIAADPSLVRIVRIPYLPAVMPLLGSGLIMAGLWRQKRWWCWVGSAALLAYTLLFFTSYGLLFLPAALLLLLLLAVGRVREAG